MALVMTSASVHAVDDNSIPSSINYRGRVLDSSGFPVGSNAPVNRKVTFRIWGHGTSISTADLVYAEEQTVAILNGDFSALIGQGTRLVGANGGTAAGATSVIALSNSFNNSERYLGVTVDDGTPAVDKEITPRQQIVSSAFAFRSKFSEQASRVVQTTGTSTFNDATFTNATINAGTLTGNGAGLSSLNASNLTTGTVSTARLPIIGNALISDLAAGKITGQLADSQISGLSGSKITGTITNASIPAANVTGLTSTDLSNYARLTGANQAITTITSFGSGLFATGSSGGGSPPSGTGVGIDFKNDTGYIGAFTGKNLILNVAGGNVSIGNGVPQRLFHVYGEAKVDGNLLSGSLNTGAIVSSSITNSGALSSGSISTGAMTASGLVTANSGIRVAAGQRVGIGTASPNSPLHIEGFGDVISKADNTYMDAVSVHDENGYNSLASIYASYQVHASGFRAFSDERIKFVKGISDGAQDLGTLCSIQITDYVYRDNLLYSSALQKKVIAQQLEKIMPQAVSKTTSVVPDIFQKAEANNGWVMLKTDLKVGDRVRLIAGTTQEVYEVLEIDEQHHMKFRTSFVPAGDKVFVYGREVNDFRVVDYEAISMLNVSATQQIKKEKDAEVKALQEQNEALLKRVAALEAAAEAAAEADVARDAKLAAIEKLLRSGADIDKPVARTASLQGR